MTNAELIQKIRNEIERLKAENESIKCASNNAYCTGYNDAFYDILSFLSSLESEKPMDQEGLDEELDRFIASGKSVTVDDYGTYKVSYHDFKKVARHFAEWQKEQDDRLVDIIYQQGIEKGKDEMKEQMLKEAVEGFIFQSEDYYPKELVARYDGELKHGDKVKLIIIKED